jgi:VIT1/CCC1 family predicted Fe2+/Mn2+ transporter
MSPFHFQLNCFEWLLLFVVHLFSELTDATLKMILHDYLSDEKVRLNGTSDSEVGR